MVIENYGSLLFMGGVLVVLVFIFEIQRACKPEFFKKIYLEEIFINSKERILTIVFYPKHSLSRNEFPEGIINVLGKENSPEKILFYTEEKIEFKISRGILFPVSLKKVLEICEMERSDFTETKLGSNKALIKKN